MSDHSSSGNRPLIPGQVAVWLGAVSLVAAGLIVTGYSYLALRQGPDEDALRRQAQKDLRAENTKKAQALLTEPARNADGSFRIPLKDAVALVAKDPKVVAKLQAAAGPAPAPAAAPAAPAAASNAFVKASDEQMKRGAAVYARTCIACHQPTGLGLPPVFPPLANAPIVVGNPELPVKFILQGLMGPITVNGMTYNSMMPPVAGVSDADIADVLTYVRQSFGNQGNPVTADQVKAIRAANAGRTAPWTTAELGLK
ncbi:MAG: cytochrome c [Opitutales bacterium]|jgi:mono/diheme cytochrome c family protein|nr:cytochrome c [Opitutales bacterium]MDP4658728.1 cytochrome c [Opitutales bacterium]MDP4774540.1 cytochrome c [Opitutales bacterium]MDP4787711.1 cytochrome c [Opitutales bacterium]MDP4860906.1 cytochrome c [Opitutales bacterium]